MTITSMDALVAAMPGQPFHPWKASITSKAIGTFESLWKAAGIPGAGNNPPAFSAGSGYVPDKTTQGAINFSNPGGGTKNYLAVWKGLSINASGMLLYDRLWACSGFDGTATGVQAVTTPGAITRPDALGATVEIWLSIYTAIGATSRTLTVNYINQDGNAATTTVATPVSPVAGQETQVPLATGDTGCRQITSVQLSASTGTAGNFGITLRRRIQSVFIALATAGWSQDFAATGLSEIIADVCMEFIMLCQTTVTGVVSMSLNVING